MGAGYYIAGIVFTILAMASFSEGGLFIISGILCSMAVIGLAITFYNDDIKRLGDDNE